MQNIISTEQLPRPVIYKGGYVYRQASVGLLDGQTLPRSERWTSQPWEKTCKRAECLQILEAAPVGSVYAYLEFSENGEIEYQWEYRKIKSGQWIALA